MFKKRDGAARTYIIAAMFSVAMGAIAYAQGFAIPSGTQVLGLLGYGGSPPVGTGCTIASGSTDSGGNCTTSAASGSIAFTKTYNVAPNCVLVDATSAATVPQVTYTVTTAQITLTTVTSAHVLRWHCDGTASF